MANTSTRSRQQQSAARFSSPRTSSGRSSGSNQGARFGRTPASAPSRFGRSTPPSGGRFGRSAVEPRRIPTIGRSKKKSSSKLGPLGGLLSAATSPKKAGRKAKNAASSPPKGALVGGLALAAAAGAALRKRKSDSTEPETVYTGTPDTLPNTAERPVNVTPAPGA